jgi:hypothetical protein
MISGPNLHERTAHISFDESPFHVVKNAPNEYSDGIIIFERNLDIHPLLGNAETTKVTGLTNICGMRWESDNLDAGSGKLLEYIIVHVN